VDAVSAVAVATVVVIAADVASATKLS
jgi:hypothetical protein